MISKILNFSNLTCFPRFSIVGITNNSSLGNSTYKGKIRSAFGQD